MYGDGVRNRDDHQIVAARAQGRRSADHAASRTAESAIAPHLNTFRDGWRTLRFFLLCTPRRLFLVPGVILIVLGILAYGLALPGDCTESSSTPTRSYSEASRCCVATSRYFSRFSPKRSRSDKACYRRTCGSSAFNTVNLEVGLGIAALALIVGLVLLGAAVDQCDCLTSASLTTHGRCDWLCPALVLTGLGFQAILSAFLISFPSFNHRRSGVASGGQSLLHAVHLPSKSMSNLWLAGNETKTRPQHKCIRYDSAGPMDV